MKTIKEEIIEKIEEKQKKIKEQQDIISKELAGIKEDLKKLGNSCKEKIKEEDEDKEV